MIIFILLAYVSSALATEGLQEMTEETVVPSSGPKIVNRFADASAAAVIQEIIDTNAVPSVPEMVTGLAVRDGMYPFVVAIFESGEQVCGGSILSTKFVITVARCVDKAGNYSVVAGTVDITKEGIRRKIEKIKLHPMYHFGRYDLLYNVAIVKLESALPLHPDKITAVKLPRAFSGVPFESGTALGWGLTDSEEIPSSILMAVRLSRDCCNEQEYYFCVGYHYDPRDFCRGDNGSPFIINRTLYGIISHNGKLDCASGFPRIFVNVPQFIEFINYTLQRLI